MPSEKLRYLERDRGPQPPFPFTELRERMLLLDSEHLAEILHCRAQRDKLLQKILFISIALANGDDIEVARAAVDYALHFSDYVRYFEHGHGQILDEIRVTLQKVANDHLQFAIEVGEYAIARANKISENFEDDWEWRCSLERLLDYVERVTAERSQR